MRKIAIALTTMLLALTSAHAADVLLKGRNVQQKNESVVNHQAKDKSYGSGTFRSQGLTILEDSKIATYVTQGAFSWGSGGAQHTGILVRKYPDGSMTTLNFSGTSRKGEGQRVQVWNGTADLVSGTGRFKGAKGHGTYEGGRYANGMGVTDWEVKAVLVE
jgi:hypothetical protein